MSRGNAITVYAAQVLREHNTYKLASAMFDFSDGLGYFHFHCIPFLAFREPND
jgi:hypothetical protein